MDAVKTQEWATGEQASVKLAGLAEDEVAQKLLGLVQGGSVRWLYVDLRGIPSVSGRMLGAFLAVHRGLRGRGGSLHLTGASPFVHEIFQVTRLAEVIDVRR